MSPETGAGAWLCASGSQLCIGASPALVAKPRIARATATLTSEGSSAGGLWWRVFQDRVASPAARVAAYSSTMPRNAIATPTEPRTTYFQAASSERRVRWWPTRNAVAIVVASTATHSTPRLSASTARDIAPRNSTTRTAYSRPGSASGSGSSPPQVAVSPTEPTTISMNAESASALSWPPSAVTVGLWSTADASARPHDKMTDAVTMPA
jgi:hypothetical protein